MERALPLADGNDVELKATLLCDRCYCLFKHGRMTEAIEAGQQAMQFCLSLGPSVYLARAYLYLAICNNSLPNPPQAKLFIQKAIDVDEQIGTNSNSHNILGIACEIYAIGQEPEKAIEYGRRAVEAARAIGYEEGVVNHLSQLSYAYNRQGDYLRGLEVARQAVEAVEKMNVPDRNLLAISLEYVAYNLLDMKRNAEAVPILLRAIKLEQEVGNTRSVCYDYKSLAEAYEPDEPRQAVTALRKYITMADSIHNAQMSEALGKANAEFRNNELQDENSMRRRQNQLIIVAASAVALLLLAVIAFVVYAYRLRGKINRSLRQQQLAQEAFFTNVTHEFRTPLTVILGLSRKMQGTDASLIEHEGNRLLQLVNQLLDVARMKSGAANPQWQRGDIVPLLTMIAESMQQLADSRRVTLTYHHEEQAQEADFVSDYVQKIVGNLLTNALKNTEAGGNVTLNSRSNNDKVIVSVADTGIGIAPEDLPHIFEPFYMGRNSQNGNSTGIGLTLTKQLVEAMNGNISVESTVGKGTTVTVTMPSRQKASPSPYKGGDVELHNSTESLTILDNQTPPPLERLGKASREGAGEGLSILIVEDNREVAYFTGMLLSPYYDVYYADDGEQGLEKARELMPDIIVTDVMMPRMNGLELCRQLRCDELTCHIPVIVVTAKVTEKDRLEGLHAGATAYLNKPFNEDELLTVIGNLLQQQKETQKKVMKTIGNGAQKSYSNMLEEINDEFLDRLRTVVVEHMKDEKTDVEHLAPLMTMSETQLRRKVAAVTGTSLGRYVTLMRIEEAKKLLKMYPRISIKDAGYQTGFADNAHFSKVFRRITGMSPMEYINGVKS